jgi:outer membrane immunogenic protein
LVYAAGGGALTSLNSNLTANAGGLNVGLASLSNTAFGWTVGAGVEAAFAANWTARVEYLFIDTSPSANGAVSPLAGGGNLNLAATVKDNLVRAGVNYKFW